MAINEMTPALQLVASPWAQHLKPSPTLAIKEVADQLKLSGVEVFDFGVGEMNPFVPVPLALRQAIAAAQLVESHSHYTAAPGDNSLLEALSEDFRRFGMTYAPHEIVICPGPKDAIFKACIALVNPAMPRNRVVAFAPSYEAFENVPPLTTGKPAIILPTDDRFFPKVDELERLLATDPTIAIIIVNSPNNPTGVVYPASLIADLAQVIGKYPQVAVISDESYRTAIYSDEPYSSIAHHLPLQTLVVAGISKELSSTGLRLGWVAGPAQIIRVIANVHGNATSSCGTDRPTDPIYQIQLARLKVSQTRRAERDMESRKEIKRQLQLRRDIALELFSSLPHLKRCKLTASQGAFYLFPDVTAFLDTRAPSVDEADAAEVIRTDKELALYLLRAAKVVAIPGSEFQRAGHLRLCYARDEATLRAGFQAMDAALARLSPASK
ncbi:aminotransferase, class I/II superfamily protein [Acanthamoeba castellanii str. Neff]|uniref:Aminotransferase, class I/II superfamily protein n=1 Tax=Acanthamoeba castellanii (strain ATCC 30010 / Neff) TaxID=1257118 RepID=L8GP13_ACACF|nr:aminotransferase, class I/II superfamily protein [Acanthamoeba castellanii str. Neff]ELR14710.1 aminotransferase, class I/II superfamily protein [Acanthamoeba castellanii str. Neff]